MTNERIERFNSGAEGYKTDRYPVRGECMKKVLELLEPGVRDVVLDVGCGPGAQLIDLSRSIKFGYGVDPAEQMIRQAKKSGADRPNLKFYVGSAENLPREIQHIDINKVISNYALHHLSDAAKRQAVDNLTALLPDNGTIVLGDLMFSDDPDKYKDLFDVVGYGPGCDTPSQLSLIEDMFIKAGLSTSIHILNPLVAVIVARK